MGAGGGDTCKKKKKNVYYSLHELTHTHIGIPSLKCTSFEKQNTHTHTQTDMTLATEQPHWVQGRQEGSSECSRPIGTALQTLGFN